MRWIFSVVLAVFASCTVKDNSDDQGTTKTINDIETRITQIPANGTYRYDMAFAEWGGKSMGEKVTVIIKGDSVRVVYEGDGALTAKSGEVLDEGKILKHKSGVWIIAHHKHDVDLDEIGGCTDGPRIIDFNSQKFWTC